MSNYSDYMQDELLKMSDAGAVAADAVAQVGGSDGVIDVGPGKLRDGAVVDIRVTEAEAGNADETYFIVVQGSTDAFSSVTVELLRYEIVRGTTGRSQIPVTNEKFGTVYDTLRLYNDVGGTSPSLNYTAYLTGRA